jgi:hypothetical protein
MNSETNEFYFILSFAFSSIGFQMISKILFWSFGGKSIKIKLRIKSDCDTSKPVECKLSEIRCGSSFSYYKEISINSKRFKLHEYQIKIIFVNTASKIVVVLNHI